MLENINIQSFILMLLMIIICIIGIFLLIIPLLLKEKKEQPKKDNLSKEKNTKIEINSEQEELKKTIFDLYKKSEVAKTKFNYDNLKELLTESLYKEEEQKLQQLKNEKLKLVATNIKLQEIKILSITKKNEIETINVYLHVSQYDYVTNAKKKVVRGTDKAEYQIEYKLTIEKNKDKYFKIKKKECTGKWIKKFD